MRRVHPILARQRPPGSYRLHPRPGLGAIVDDARAEGWRTVVIDGRRCSTKAGLLRRLAAELRFPPWFGHNWDALEDCLGDLDLGDGGLCLVWDAADVLGRRDPDAALMLARIVNELAAQGRRIVLLARSRLPLTGYIEV
jgi:RNAse (barnase) inhibitor barstar